MGAESYRNELLQKRAIRLITNSSYTAHTTPLFIELGFTKSTRYVQINTIEILL